MILLASLAMGQSTPNLQHFSLAGSASGFATVPSARQLTAMGFGFDAVAQYGHRPLQRTRLLEDGRRIRDAGGIDSLFAVHLRAAFAPTDWLEISAGAPALQVASTGEAIVDYGGAHSILATGDVTAQIALRPLPEELMGVALVPFVSLPTGTRTAFLSYSEPTVGGRLVLSKTLEPVHIAANVGYRFLPSGGYLGTTVGVDDELLYGGGIGFTMVPERVRFNVEVTGAQIVGPARGLALDQGLKNSLHAPLELLGDVRVDTPTGVSVVFGGGPGLTAAAGTPAFRAFLGLSWRTPAWRDTDGDGLGDRDDACPEEPEDVDGFEDADGCPDPDNDGDGVLDRRDRCPLQPEDPDGFQDTDGCPDPDNDKDGLLDAVDQCPLQPEDLDGVDDFDGCPDYSVMVVDTDQDGVLDTTDQCVAQPEDYDGYLDTDGCPDPDNDLDEILDVDDACPLQPEIVNGVDDEDGCPDEGRVRLTESQIVILEKVLFLTGKAVIVEESFPLLQEVLATLQAHPEIARVKIEGHTDSRGSESYNLDLSTRRANAIRDWLIQGGVDADRLEAEGFGEFSPLVENDSPENMEKNRRVEFHILETR
jgi:outer membrane protein OmpA-like peptidoglycan-associated protein